MPQAAALVITCVKCGLCSQTDLKQTQVAAMGETYLKY